MSLAFIIPTRIAKRRLHNMTWTTPGLLIHTSLSRLTMNKLRTYGRGKWNRIAPDLTPKRSWKLKQQVRKEKPMSVIIAIPTALRQFASGQSQFEVEAA